MNIATTTCRTPEERERLILQHMRQVQWIASNVRERLPETVLQEDLVSAGIVGLIAAVDNFDASRNASLRTYAEHKIRGAILDSVRALDAVPTHRRRRAKTVQSAMEAAERRLQRVPSEEEIASELGMELEQYRRALCDIQNMSTSALETDSEEGGGACPLRYLADREESSPGWIVERGALQRLLAAAIRTLPQVERTIIGLYFMEELSLSEIASILQVHTSRVSQLKLQAVLRLRTYMQKRWPGRAC